MDLPWNFTSKDKVSTHRLSVAAETLEAGSKNTVLSHELSSSVHLFGV